MRSLKEMVSPGLIAAGMLIGAGSIVDAQNNTAAQEYGKKQTAITESAENTYGVQEYCDTNASGFAMYTCGYSVDGNPNEEERQARISAYETEIAEKMAGVPPLDPASKARQELDIAGFFAGLAVTSVGAIRMAKSKE